MKDIAPTTIVIFGITGDLASRYLIPAFFDLSQRGVMPEKYRIVGFSRRPFSTEEFSKLVGDSLAKKNPTKEQLEEFLSHAEYRQGNFDEAASYQGLAERLQKIDDEMLGQCSNKLFYLAVPPNLYEGIFERLSLSGLTIPCGGNLGWTRVLVEKPFGRDSATAEKLDSLLGSLFQETQIFRIDHYLAKETLQNILTFRFSNSMFEPLWNKEHIESVWIRLHEKLDVLGRGAFFDDAGMLRDVGQNHILQMLALIAMEQPKDFSADAIRARRAELFRSLIPIGKGEMAEKVIRAQYEGYAGEKGVKEGTETETYFRIEAGIANKRWEGVPFYLEAGKALSDQKAEIEIRFRKSAPAALGSENGSFGNSLTFRIQPNQGIALRFFTKTPGLAFQAEAKTLAYSYAEASQGLKIPDAYEKVLYDCIRGDQTLFTSTDEVHATWKYATPIIENMGNIPLHEYPKGSSPESVIETPIRKAKE